MRKINHYAPPALTMGIPIGYIVAEHISWKRKKPDSLRRMIIQQASFWIAAIAGGILMHDTHFQKRPLAWKLPRFTLASALLIAGFAGGERLARLLYPKEPAFEDGRSKAASAPTSWGAVSDPRQSQPGTNRFPSPAVVTLNSPFNANQREHSAV
jgi:hypothetical protein